MKTKTRFFCIVIFIFVNIFIFRTENSADAYEKVDELFLKSYALIETCLDYIRLNNYDKAEETLDTTYKIAKNINEPILRAIIFYEIVDKYIVLDKNEKAFGLAKEIEFSDVKDEAYAKIAYKYVELGDYRKAQVTARQIKDHFSAALSLYKMINKFHELGLYEEAIKMVDSVVVSSYVVGKLITVQFLSKKIGAEDKRGLNRQYLEQIHALEDPYKKCILYIKMIKLYLFLWLYWPAKDILSVVESAAEDIKSEPLKKDILSKIENLSKRISKFEKAVEKSLKMAETKK